MQEGVYFEQEIQSSTYCDQADRLQQIFENIMIFIFLNIYFLLGDNG